MKIFCYAILLAALNYSLDAAEISGVVQEAAANSATVRVQGDQVPALGDKAEIFFKLAGSEDEISVAAGEVSKVTGNSVEIKIEGSTGEVTKDQLVRITSGSGQKASASTLSPSPGNPAGYQAFQDGLARHKAGDCDAAIAAYTRAIEIDPTRGETFFNRALCYQAKREWGKAIADLDRALTLKPELAGAAYGVRAETRYAQNDYAGAITDYGRAIAAAPDDARNYRGRVSARTASQDWRPEVLEDCNKAIALDPGGAENYFLRACYYAGKGVTEAAEADWNKAIALDPALEPKAQEYKKRLAEAKTGSPPGTAASAAPLPSVTPSRRGKLIVNEAFHRMEQQASGNRNVNGEVEMIANPGANQLRVWYEKARDSYAEVTARLAGAGGGFGLILRSQMKSNALVTGCQVLLTSSSISLTTIKNGELIGTPDTRSWPAGVLLKPNQTVQFGVQAVERDVVVFINDTPIARFNNDTLPEAGGFALIGTAGPDAPCSVYFDNLKVYDLAANKGASAPKKGGGRKR